MSVTKLNKHLLVFCALINSLFASAGAPTKQSLLFFNDFNSLTPGTPVGEGGPAVGEPVSIGALQAHIQQISATDNAIIVERVPNVYSGGHVRWEFLDQTEATNGNVLISFEFIPSDLDDYSLLVRERGGSSQAFMDLIYDDTGAYQVNDQSGAIPFASGSYLAGQSQRILMTFDMDAGTSELFINESLVFSNRQHGITERGVGSLLTGFESDTEFSPFTIDELKVVGDVSLPLVMDVDLEDKTLGNTIGEGGAAVGEPFLITSDIGTKIVANSTGGQSLLLTDIREDLSSKGVIWQFLNDLEVLSGLLIIEMDVEFSEFDQYRFTITDELANGTTFSSITFDTDGTFDISDRINFYQEVGSYQLNQVHNLKFEYNLDSGIYSVFWDSQTLIDQQSFGTDIGTGIARIRTGFLPSTEVDSSFIIDDFQVGSSFIADDIIFKGDFEQNR